MKIHLIISIPLSKGHLTKSIQAQTIDKSLHTRNYNEKSIEMPNRISVCSKSQHVSLTTHERHN